MGQNNNFKTTEKNTFIPTYDKLSSIPTLNLYFSILEYEEPIYISINLQLVCMHVRKKNKKGGTKATKHFLSPF